MTDQPQTPQSDAAAPAERLRAVIAEIHGNPDVTALRFACAELERIAQELEPKPKCVVTKCYEPPLGPKYAHCREHYDQLMRISRGETP